MTYRSFALNFDSEVHLFDCLSSIMSQVDDLEGPTGLEVVENSQTLDTTSADEVRSVQDWMNAQEPIRSRFTRALFWLTAFILKLDYMN